MWSRALQVALIIGGLLIAAFALTLGAAPPTCRGVVMGPGDTCQKAGGSGVQTYEGRMADRRQAAPVVIGLGLVAAGFGGVLLRGTPGSSDRRRPGPPRRA